MILVGSLLNEYKFICYILLLLIFSSCFQSEESLITISGNTMGTTYTVKYIKPQNKPVHQKIVLKKIEEDLLEINKKMSTYISDSELTLLNNASSNKKIKLSDDLFKVLDKSLQIASATSGFYDPTLGPLINLWGFGPKGKRKIPSDIQIIDAKQRVGHKKISISRRDKSVIKLVDGMYIDLSSLAKGYGVDVLANSLEEFEINNYMVEIGGEVKAKGLKHKSKWKIGIESPFEKKDKLKIIELSNKCIATSGSYRNFFIENKQKFSHTINYKTGRPVRDSIISVSVMHKTCMEADAWATALMAIGYRNAFIVAKLNNLDVYLIYKDDRQQGNNFIVKKRGRFWPKD
jgi:FAD:protein FMN transferase